MIRHVVMWKFKDEAEGATKMQNLEKVKGMLEALVPQIDLIKSLEVNFNVNPKEGMFDAVLMIDFDTLQDVATYTAHPEHKKVSQFVAKVRTDRASVDFEI